jgi:hypothetical protein
MIETRKTEGSSGKNKIRIAGGGSVSACHSSASFCCLWTGASSSKVLVTSYQSTQPHIPEECKIHHESSQNIKPHRSQIGSKVI